jgi:hypothetical protein
MPSFDEAFVEAKGAPIIFNGIELVRIDKIPVNKKFSGSIRLLSVKSKWKQGIRIKLDGILTINSTSGNDFIIWASDMDVPVIFNGEIKKGQLMVWNAWDSGRGGIDAWLGGAAMNIVIDGNRRIYKCNDGHPDDNFDDIIFEILINDL